MYAFPCKDCSDRHIACHSTCQKYIDAKTKHNSEVETYRKKNTRPIRPGDFLGDSGLTRHKRF